MTDVKDLYKYPGDVDAFGFDWGQLSVTLGPKVNGASSMSAAVVSVPPGQGHARHNHPGSEEIIYILEGEGEQMVEDEDGNPHTETVRAGCTIFIPESRFHSTLNTGSAEMKIFVVYSPAGPEELLKEAPDFHLIPAGG
ncbi:cupin domain-containing protein [Chachezhania antarctica]|uniref:cupin domain-containing protein n=1 Tax=Chachezhania antarctica TaxID=2340860 RepID=UPI000EB3D74B|nr:cupin domain-containing protein [Chachezhania antarctica]|tara:strand:- start:5507 stop:5923 length:417 start_codon:yes stop_codon:yes gene_type:complete